MPSDLPILSPDPPARSQAERYGGLYYLGIGGLAVVLLLVVWFAAGLWSLRGYLAEVYTLHDPGSDEEARVNAALALSRSDRSTQRQYWEDALDRRLPEPARYLMAESLSAEAAESDSRGFALSASRSEGWPDWLRVLLVRPMAYAARPGAVLFPDEALVELKKRPDPILGAWATSIRAIQGDAASRAELDRLSREPGPARGLALILVDAISPDPDLRLKALDLATKWTRSNHPGAIAVWQGWETRDGRLRKVPPRRSRAELPGAGLDVAADAHPG